MVIKTVYMYLITSYEFMTVMLACLSFHFFFLFLSLTPSPFAAVMVALINHNLFKMAHFFYIGFSLTIGILVSIFAVFCTIIVTATATFCVSYFCFKRKKPKNGTCI